LDQGLVNDCNDNGIPDLCDLNQGTSADSGGDGIPDECQGVTFLRGECNGDGSISIADVVFHLDYLFNGGPESPCLRGCDANDDAGVDLSDGIYTLQFLFVGGPPPPDPWPDCGLDPTADTLPCPLNPACP
ncbi:MAG: hypothetical protein ACPG1Z_11135, partial [Planctomycetota bacterium]